MDESIHGHVRPIIIRTLHSQGITKSSSVAVDVLSDLLDKYLKLLVESCSGYATHAGRTSLSVYDAIASLREMGTELDDLNDYAAVEGAEMQRFAQWPPRKQAELTELNDALHIGLRVDRSDAIHLRYTRLPTPDNSDAESPPESISPSSSRESTPLNFPFQFPLSPISNSPPDTHEPLKKRPRIGPSGPDFVPDFFPPFPVVLPDEAEDQPPQPEPEPEPEPQEDDSAPRVAIPATYIAPAPYDLSRLQSRGAWHLPVLTQGPTPEVPNGSTNSELLAALNAVTADPSLSTLASNPGRHKVSMVFLGTTPVRYNTPDTLFGLGNDPTPRSAPPLPSHVTPLPEKPSTDKNRNRAPAQTVIPGPQPRSVGSVIPILNAVTGTSSRMPVVGRSLLSKPVQQRTKRLLPPPALKREDKVLLYHPNLSIPAPWNSSVTSSNVGGGAYSSTSAVPDCTLSFTWDWPAKAPNEILQPRRAPPPSVPAVPKISAPQLKLKHSTIKLPSASSSPTHAQGSAFPFGPQTPSTAIREGSMLPPPIPTSQNPEDSSMEIEDALPVTSPKPLDPDATITKLEDFDGTLPPQSDPALESSQLWSREEGEPDEDSMPFAAEDSTNVPTPMMDYTQSLGYPSPDIKQSPQPVPSLFEPPSTNDVIVTPSTMPSFTFDFTQPHTVPQGATHESPVVPELAPLETETPVGDIITYEEANEDDMAPVLADIEDADADMEEWTEVNMDAFDWQVGLSTTSAPPTNPSPIGEP